MQMIRYAELRYVRLSRKIYTRSTRQLVPYKASFPQRALLMASERRWELHASIQAERICIEQLLRRIVIMGGTALYLRAERQYHGAHWADNSGKGAAGERAMALTLAGAPEAEVEAALRERRDVDVWGL